MLNYLYYKLYRASLKSSLKDIPEFMTAVSFGGLININIMILNILLSKLNIMSYIFSNSIEVGVFAFTSIALSMLYFNKKRIKWILEKYSQESNKQRIRGNVFVAIYVGISFLFIFLVPLFKPGEI